MFRYKEDDTDLAKELADDISGDLIKMSDIATDYVVAASPVDTGLFKGNWNVSIDEEYDGSFIHEDPDGTVTKSEMKADVGTFNLNHDSKIYIQNNVKDPDNDFEGYAATVAFDSTEKTAMRILSGATIKAVEGTK